MVSERNGEQEKQRERWQVRETVGKRKEELQARDMAPEQMTNLHSVRNLLENLVYIVHDQRIVGQVHVHSECVSPPPKA